MARLFSMDINALVNIWNPAGSRWPGHIDPHALLFSLTFLDAPIAAAIPEPETYALMLAGLGLLGFAARRRKQKEAAFA